MPTGLDVPHARACLSRAQLAEVLRSLRDNVAPQHYFDATYLIVVGEAATALAIQCRVSNSMQPARFPELRTHAMSRYTRGQLSGNVRWAVELPHPMF